MAVATSTKEKYFNWGWLTVQRFSPLSGQEAWRHAGGHGAREVAKSSTFRSAGGRSRITPAWPELLKSLNLP